MFNLKLATLFPRRPSLPVVPIPKRVQFTLFKRKPPWGVRWALVLIALDAMVSATAIQVTWNWKVAPDHKKDATNGTEMVSESDKPVLQPVWRRSVFCFVHFMSGCAVAGSILAARTRAVRSITVSQRSTNPMAGLRLYLETAHHPLHHGHEISLKRCNLVESINKQLSIEVTGHGRWPLNLRGASINGEPATLSPSLNHDSMIKAWQIIRQHSSNTFPSTSKIPK